MQCTHFGFSFLSFLYEMGWTVFNFNNLFGDDKLLNWKTTVLWHRKWEERLANHDIIDWICLL